MEQRINVHTKGQNAFKSLYGMTGYLKKSPVEDSLLELVYFRVSQINNCAYCLDMHSKAARHKGEMEKRRQSLKPKKINLTSNHFYYSLLGNLYTDLNNKKALQYYETALTLANSLATRQV